MVAKEARGVILWTTGQVILDHTFVLHQEGWDDLIQVIASQILTYDLILRILDYIKTMWLKVLLDYMMEQFSPHMTTNK